MEPEPTRRLKTVDFQHPGVHTRHRNNAAFQSEQFIDNLLIMVQHFAPLIFPTQTSFMRVPIAEKITGQLEKLCSSSLRQAHKIAMMTVDRSRLCGRKWQVQ